MSGNGSEATLVDLLIRICETPAPTFAEEARADLVADILREVGLEPRIDAVGNVVAQAPGGYGPRLLLAAHLDTVFPAATDVTVHCQKGRLCAPGIGDNSASLAVMLHFVREAVATRGHRHPRLTVAATVGEEGLGNLRGIRHLVAERRDDFDAVIALDGHLGTIVDAGVGSKRFEVIFRGPGGHSWGDYPSPSAIHALGEAIHRLNGLSPPRNPRSSLNVGQVWGGTSVNAIAQEAGFNLDVRSLDPGVLAGLVDDAMEGIHEVARHHRVTVICEQVGDRPAARVDNRELIALARRALAGVAVRARTTASSTDANAAMAAGIPAIAFGVYRGGDAHRLSEWLEPASLVVGLRALEGFLCEVAREGRAG